MAILAKWKHGPGFKVINMSTPAENKAAKEAYDKSVAEESARIKAAKPVDAKRWNLIAKTEQLIKNLEMEVKRAPYAYQKSSGGRLGTSMVDMVNHPAVKRLAQLKSDLEKLNAGDEPAKVVPAAPAPKVDPPAAKPVAAAAKPAAKPVSNPAVKQGGSKRFFGKGNRK
jgi:hypothetical protein